MPREKMEFDVIIVGAGPAGLSAAIRLIERQPTIQICILEKGAEVGAQILSGAVLEPRALNELIPNWQELNPPPYTPVTEDQFLFLTSKNKYRLPTPAPMQNHGNFIISLGQFCRWLGEHAERLGVNIFPGFAATEIIYDNNRVVGVITGDKGLNKQGEPTERYQAGIELYAKQTLFAEGCRGSLTQTLFEKFNLRSQCDPQTYGLGIKEIWEIPKEFHQSGLVMHSVGWPLDNMTYGGSFIYHLHDNLMAIGFVVGLDYRNPYLNPYEEFQRFKSHPSLKPLLEKSKRIAYGARTLNEGGFQSIPQLNVEGGLLIGCSAGFLNVPKIKGIHTAMKSGIVAADSLSADLTHNTAYPENLKKSWVWDELFKVRNIRPAMNKGLWPGLLYAAFDTYLLKGKAPWTFQNHADYAQLKKAAEATPITYSKHDNKTTFDLMNSVFLTNIHYEENQPCHLKIKNMKIELDVTYQEFASPEQRYCPAGVYEILLDEQNQPKLQINNANCIHCKACDIKDPKQNIVWTPPEGGSGPHYTMM